MVPYCLVPLLSLHLVFARNILIKIMGMFIVPYLRCALMGIFFFVNVAQTISVYALLRIYLPLLGSPKYLFNFVINQLQFPYVFITVL